MTETSKKQTADFYEEYYEELTEIAKKELFEMTGKVLEQMDSFIQDRKSENSEQFQNKYGDLDFAMLAELCINGSSVSITER